MRRFVFRPRWMLGHLLVVAAALACVWLGDWQWGRAHVTGSAQNWGYAFQWPLFAVCFLIGWWRMLRLESIRLDELAAADAEPGTAAADAGTPPRVLSSPLLAPASGPAAPAPGARPEDDEDDPELAAYNRMLAALAERDRER